MSDKPATNADMNAANDRGESVSLMEPLLIAEGSRHRPDLVDQVMGLTARSSRLRHRLPGGLVRALAGLVRSMNCYYSNLIEGHDTHPVAIERALNDDFSVDPRQRDLQLEAKSHIAAQQWIDNGGLADRAACVEGLRELHRRFCEHLPKSLLVVEHPQTGKPLPVVPGNLRQHDVQVGRHVPISPGSLPRFLTRFEQVYGQVGRTEGVLAAACAHHRLLWLHPFLDGNGRVAHLMSYALLLDRLETGAIWSVARGLARNEGEYKARLMACDLERRNDLDGRGHLSEEALAEFVGFFLNVCLDQVDFMERLVEPAALTDRVVRWARDEIERGRLAPRSDRVLEAALYRGELPRGEVVDIAGVSERQARRVSRGLLDTGIVTAESTRAPLRLTFPAHLASRLMPGLFPEPSESVRGGA
ncbi:Fic family protein [Spectribacter hydrogenooxidans]|uniref:Fic family protein n=1 Tax=Spectribacter hydrogenoxidans TaxID=3075608 RepID=A0ABU3C0X5_9GAMM|nr:Fic family protein [Salinisphaera sp. W335]MDT0635204.1 Fic family protein [Salinisphaera sp. W335]